MKTFKISVLFVALMISFQVILSCSKATNPSPESFTIRTTDVANDIEWANPDGNSLKMDIHYPSQGKKIYPVLVIIHGGGWLKGDKSGMSCMAEYIVKNSDYVVCNTNYRLLKDNNNTITMNQMVEDVFGAILWVKDHISSYNGDPSKIVVTGDSAGGHLASLVVLAGDNLETDGFEGTSIGFNPTYRPDGKSAEQIANQGGLEVQGAIFSYAAFQMYFYCLDGTMETDENVFWSSAGVEPRGLFGNEINIQDNPEYYIAVSPWHLVPTGDEKKLPPILCTVGSHDTAVPPQEVIAFVRKLKENGHTAEYWEHTQRNHAFLECDKPNQVFQHEFEKDAIPAINKMIDFMNNIFTQ